MMKIEIPNDEKEKAFHSPTKSQSSPTSLIARISKTPPELTQEDLAARAKRAEALAELDTNAKIDRARRANERVKENIARKLRLEAAAVSRAEAKLTKQSEVKSARQEERESKRQAAAERSRALFNAVRAAREERQATRTARLAALSELECRAASLKAKSLHSTVAKSAQVVRHAAQVVAAQKAAEEQARSTAASELDARLAAATSRRHEKLQWTVEGCASAVAAAERICVRRKLDEKLDVEARRMRLGKAMERALGRRQSALADRVSKAAAENARVASAVEEQKKEAEAKPLALAHSLTVKMQAAEITHSLALAQATRAATAQAKLRRPELIVIPAFDTASTPTPARAVSCPPAHLLERLMFRPRLLLATAKARQAGAPGRRKMLRELRVARSLHYGTLRVAAVTARKAAFDEISRSVAEVRAKTATETARVALKARADKAAKMSQRVIAAKLQRSVARLALINDAIVTEEKRRAAGLRRIERLQSVTAKAKAAERRAGFQQRRQAADDKRAAKGVANQRKLSEATSRRALHVSATIAKATRASRRANGPAGTKVAPAPEGTWQRLAAQVVETAFAHAIIAATSTPTVGAALDLERKARVERAAATSEAAAAVALKKAAAKQAGGETKAPSGSSSDTEESWLEVN